MRQYLTARFSQTDARAYTYHNDGEPVAPGEHVKLPAKTADGFRKGYVSTIISEEEALAQPFETKGILGKLDPIEPQPEA